VYYSKVDDETPTPRIFEITISNPSTSTAKKKKKEINK